MCDLDKKTIYEEKVSLKEANPSLWAEKYIIECIIQDVFEENSFLPPQRQLAETLDVPRWALRLALKRLSKVGFIESSRGRGTRVVTKNKLVESGTTIAVIRMPLRAGNMEAQHIRDGILCRMQQLRCDFVEISLHDKSQSSSPLGENSRTVNVDSLSSLLDEFSAFIFLELGSYFHKPEQPGATFINELVARKLPFVVANLEEKHDVSSTCIDHADVTVRAVKTVAGFGHERIAYLGTAPNVYFYDKSLQGYRDGMHMMNLPVDESLVVFCEDTTAIDAYLSCKKLIDREDYPTAIIAARDLLANSVCSYITERGMKVGRDISVIGFDDVSWEGTEPFLTTFHEPCTELGSLAVDMLLDRIRDKTLPIEKKVLDAPLILRRSVGPL